jgi:hypothetical protein
MSEQKSLKIFTLIPKAMAEIGAIGKNRTNTHQNYKFRSIDDIYNKIQPVLAKHGIFFTPTVLETKEELFESANAKRSIRVKSRIKYTFYADDGSQFDCVVEGEAIDTSDKATNKAFTACLKYMLIQVFCIAIEGDDDADSESPEIGAPKQKPVTSQSRQYTAKSNVHTNPPPKTNPPAPTTQAKPTPPVNNPLNNAKNIAASPGDYVVQVGRKYKGKKLSDIPHEELKGYISWLEENSANPPSSQVLELSMAANNYLNGVGNAQSQ